MLQTIKADISLRLKYFKKLVLTFIYSLIILITVGTFSSFADNTLSNMNYIKTKNTNQCLTLSTSKKIFYLANCNFSSSQNISSYLGTLRSNNNCLTLSTSSNTIFNSIKCNNGSNQTFLVTGNKFYSTEEDKCLDYSSGSLSLKPCSSKADSTQDFLIFSLVNHKSSIYNPLDCSNFMTINEKLSCNSMSEWNNWHLPNSNHLNLLNTYSDNNGYEEWCADFVSYIYKESGNSFSYGERNYWDEYDANNIQNQNLIYHSAASYTPKAGDIAFFNYPGGHVEMVAIGGKTPTFIYGDSAKVDNQTGNGDMAANNLTSDGSLGKVVYYLSLN